MSETNFDFLERCQGMNSIYPEEAQIRDALFELSLILTKQFRENNANRRRTRYMHDDKFRQLVSLRARQLDHTLRPYWEWLCHYLNFTCQKCHQRFPFLKLTVDHIVPLSKGGKNNWDNLQPLCKPCNISKNNRHWIMSDAIKQAQEKWRKINGEIT